MVDGLEGRERQKASHDKPVKDQNLVRWNPDSEA